MVTTEYCAVRCRDVRYYCAVLSVLREDYCKSTILKHEKHAARMLISARFGMSNIGRGWLNFEVMMHYPPKVLCI